MKARARTGEQILGQESNTKTESKPNRERERDKIQRNLVLLLLFYIIEEFEFLH